MPRRYNKWLEKPAAQSVRKEDQGNKRKGSDGGAGTEVCNA
jgi:hypothetical protein